MRSLEIRNLQKTYFDPYAGTKVTAVQDVSLDIRDGEFVSLVGPSGCGKTTILNMVAGFLPVSGGEIRVGGRAVKGPGADRGVVFQSFALFPWKNVLDNVGFGPKMRGVPKAERDRIAREYLALAGLSHAAERYPNELSGGMQQRVGVVRALRQRSRRPLMDEPFASVDAQTRMTLQEELTRIWQEKQNTVLFITHDVAEAVFLADRVVVLSKGPRDARHPRHAVPGRGSGTRSSSRTSSSASQPKCWQWCARREAPSGHPGLDPGPRRARHPRLLHRLAGVADPRGTGKGRARAQGRTAARERDGHARLPARTVSRAGDAALRPGLRDRGQLRRSARGQAE
jgi:NitT/TauT family transport system ATP-binding protein